jgi:hypothetical protein
VYSYSLSNRAVADARGIAAGYVASSLKGWNMSRKTPTGEIAWTSPVTVPIVRVRPGRQIAVLRTGPFLNAWMHWRTDIARTQPCIRPRCDACLVPCPRRVLSYVPCMVWSAYRQSFAWQKGILELPLNTAAKLEQGNFEVVALSRPKKFGPVLIGSFKDKIDVPKPETFDHIQMLRCLWRLTDEEQLAPMFSRRFDDSQFLDCELE